MQKKRGIFGLIILIFFIWLALINLGKEKAPEYELILASAIYFVCCIPVLIYFARSERNIPYLPLFGVVYFTHFGLSIFNNYRLIQLNYLNSPLITKTLILVLVGFISFLIAFYSYIGKIIESFSPHLNVSIDATKAYRLALRLYFLVFFIQLISIKYKFTLLSGGFEDFIGQLPLLSIGILYLLQLQGKLKFNGKFLLWLVFIPIRFLYIISGGTFAPLVYETVTLFFIYFYYRQRIPWLFIILISLPYLFIWGARDEFRRLTWGGVDSAPYVETNPLKKSFLYLKLAYEGAFKKKEFASEAYDRLASRTNHLITFIKMVELTPDYVPYWGGYTYNTIYTSLMPRFIFPDKPQKILGQEFGHRYMLLDPSDSSTSYNLPMLIEMYINFGPLGVIIGMFILGIILRIIYSLVNHLQCGEGGLLMGAIIFINLLNIESDFSLAFGNILQYIILFYIIIRKMKVPIKRVEIIK